MFDLNIRKPRSAGKNKYQPGDDIAYLLWRDSRYNITARVAHRMVKAAYESGFCSRSVATLAADTNAAPDAVRKARQKLVRLGIFTPPKDWCCHRITLPGEDKLAHWRRMQTVKGLDLTYRCAWLLFDRTKWGPASLSYPQIAEKLHTNPREAMRAVNRVLDIGHFRLLQRGGGSGHRNTYYRHDPSAANQQVVGQAYPYSPQEDKHYEDYPAVEKV